VGVAPHRNKYREKVVKIRIYSPGVLKVFRVSPFLASPEY
jgi:hypothetical protein